MISIAGGILVVLGLLSGVLLVLAPLGVTGAEPGYITWGMFPVLSTLGYVFIATGASGATVAVLSRVMGGVTLLLAVAAIVLLFTADNGLITLTSSTKPLWYALGLGIVFGAAGLSVGARVHTETRAPK
jgi:Na+/H+ antiporter NhaD/arsenite permease-like protein